MKTILLLAALAALGLPSDALAKGKGFHFGGAKVHGMSAHSHGHGPRSGVHRGGGHHGGGRRGHRGR